MTNGRFFLDTVKSCIDVIQRSLYPDGISKDQAVAELYGILDNDEIVRQLDIAQKESIQIPLERPICCIDLETTGTNPDLDSIVEISILKIERDHSETIITRRINPMIPIPAPATAVHGIKDEDVQDCPTFATIAKSLLDFISGCDILGYHSNTFDVPFLSSMFTRAGLFWDWRAVNLIDVAVIFRRKEERTLAAAYQFYTGNDLNNAHSAEADITATKEVFFRQLFVYPDLPRTLNELALYSNFDQPILDFSRKFKLNEKNEVVFAFGPHEGKVAKNEKGFLTWMLGKDFTRDTKDFVRKLLMA